MTGTSGPLLGREAILDAFRRLGDRLARRGVIADIYVIGGAAMAVAYDARRATRDIDAAFHPHGVVREEARGVAVELGLPEWWLNEQASVYVAPGEDPGAPRIFDHPGLPCAYDLVHCRALLLHLPDPLQALRRMAGALRPGGVLLVEDADFSSFRAADPDHPAAARFDALARAAWQLPSHFRPFDPFLGGRLAALLDRLGLVDRANEALEFRRSGGSPEARLFARSLAQTRPEIVRAGLVPPAVLDEAIAALADPSFGFVDSLNVAAWGRRPMPPFVG